MACTPTPELPLDLYIEEGCSEIDMISVNLAIDEINRFTEEMIGKKGIIYKGRITIDYPLYPDGLEDGKNVLYCVNERNESYNTYLELSGESQDKKIYGTGLSQDISIFNFLMIEGDPCTEEHCNIPYNWPKDQPAPYGDIDPTIMQHVVIHELGHFIGIWHVPNTEAIMYPSVNKTLTFTEIDKIAFCCDQECTAPGYTDWREECDWEEVQ